MSKLFYDNFLDMDEVKREIDNIVETLEEKEELWQIVDEIVHNRVLSCILDNLDSALHAEFIQFYHEKPHDVGILLYLKKNIGDNFEATIIDELKNIEKEILIDIGR